MDKPDGNVAPCIYRTARLAEPVEGPSRRKNNDIPSRGPGTMKTCSCSSRRVLSGADLIIAAPRSFPCWQPGRWSQICRPPLEGCHAQAPVARYTTGRRRSEEHTSELQSLMQL